MGGSVMGWQTIVALCVMGPVFLLPMLVTLLQKKGVLTKMGKVLTKHGIIGKG
jgi:hypothetical protein